MATAQDVAAARKALDDARLLKEKTQDRIASLESRLSYSEQTGINPREAEQIRAQIQLAKFNLVRETTEVQNAQLELNQVSTAAVTPDPDPVSSGAVVGNAQQARDDGATVQNPTGTGTATEQLGSVEEPIEVDYGLDEPSLGLNISQATPAPDINTGRVNVAALVEGGLSPQEALDVAAGGIVSPATQPGVGDGRADNPIVTANTAKDIQNAAFAASTNQRITTRPNELDRYASYTYQISWYMLTDTQYNILINSPTKRNVGAWSLLMQSGGAPLPATSNTTEITNLPSRNAFFPNDYYLDDLEIKTLIPLGGTQMAHTASSIRFKVIEPNGLTLIENLYQAVKQSNTPPGAFVNDGTVPDYGAQDQKANTGTPTWIQTHYCLVIRFYGYDDNGNLVAPATGRSSDTANPAVIQKIYPFRISDLKFRVSTSGQGSRGIEYIIEGIPIGQLNGFGQARGTVPFPFALSGTTVKDLLIGKPAQAGLKPLQDGRQTKTQPQNPPTGPAPTNTGATVNNAAVGAGVDALGNFTGSGSPFGVGA